MKEGVAQKVREAGGEIFAISSEPQALAGRAVAEWGLDFETVGDPHHEIAEACRSKGWLDLFVNERLEFLRRSLREHGQTDWAPTHPKGFFQPGVLALTRGGRVLYRWRGVPTHQNMGGATERPTADHVWSRVERSLDAGDHGEDAALDADPPLDMRGVPWPVFSSLLIANGWFMNARGFNGPRMIAMAAARLVAFVAAWIAAFLWLPTLPVAIALGAWVAFIVPKFRWVGEQFQDVSAEPG